MMSDLQVQSIRQHCKTLRMPTIGTQFARLADAATREGQSHVGYLIPDSSNLFGSQRGTTHCQDRSSEWCGANGIEAKRT
jgi:hypothetical protein